jgi:predicted naringenin-chalcone synthase
MHASSTKRMLRSCATVRSTNDAWQHPHPHAPSTAMTTAVTRDCNSDARVVRYRNHAHLIPAAALAIVLGVGRRDERCGVSDDVTRLLERLHELRVELRTSPLDAVLQPRREVAAAAPAMVIERRRGRDDTSTAIATRRQEHKRYTLEQNSHVKRRTEACPWEWRAAARWDRPRMTPSGAAQ